MKLKPNASTRSPIDELQRIQQKLVVFQSLKSLLLKDLRVIRKLIDRAKMLTDKL
jgi:hypothetical protein